MLTEKDQQLIKSYYNGTLEITTSFNELAEVFSEDGTNVKSAKIFIKQKFNKVLQFSKEVFGSDELTSIVKPYINISSGQTQDS